MPDKKYSFCLMCIFLDESRRVPSALLYLEKTLLWFSTVR